MGLDMYLYAKRYVGMDDEKSKAISAVFPELAVLHQRNDYGVVKEVSAEVGYWRKANAIHNWFVENVQQGKDDCKSYFVTKEALQDLKSACESVLADPSKAESLLPSTSGFFFGSTDYDKWYFESVKDTVEIVDRAMVLQELWDIEYQSSW